MKITLERLPEQLRRGVAGAWCISGEEPLLLGEAADAVRAAAREAGFLQREVWFPERGFAWGDVLASASTLSLFGDRRLIELRFDATSPGKEAAEPLASLVRERGEDVCLLIVTARLERAALDSAWLEAVQAHGVWVPVWPVDGSRLRDWLAARCRAAGFDASAAALQLLAERVEGNLLAARQEIDKLRLLVPGTRLEAAQIIDAVADSARFDIGALGEAVTAGDAARALRVLDALRAEGEEPVLVWWALTRELHALWRLRAHGVAAEGRGPRRGPAYLRTLESARPRVTRLSFARLVERAHRADRAVKGRSDEPAWDALAAYALELAGARTVWMSAGARSGVAA
jgi:DNA polymerase III subunit delta